MCNKQKIECNKSNPCTNRNIYILQKARSYTESKILYRKQDLIQKARSYTESKVLYRKQDLIQKTRSYTESKVLYRKRGLIQKARSYTESKVLYGKQGRAFNLMFQVKALRQRGSKYTVYSTGPTGGK